MGVRRACGHVTPLAPAITLPVKDTGNNCIRRVSGAPGVCIGSSFASYPSPLVRSTRTALSPRS